MLQLSMYMSPLGTSPDSKWGDWFGWLILGGAIIAAFFTFLTEKETEIDNLVHGNRPATRVIRLWVYLFAAYLLGMLPNRYFASVGTNREEIAFI
jgi:hypothetical protein